MKKVGIFVLSLILLLPLSLAQEDIQQLQENELIVRFYSIGKQASIDLKSYLGEADEYLYIKSSENVTVTINQEAGIATLIANPGWTGIEIITFTTRKSELVTGEKTVTPKTITQITDSEISNNFYDFTNKTFSNIKENIEIQAIKSIKTEIKDDQLIINLNDEAELFFAVSGNKPEVYLNILIPNQGPSELEIFDTSGLYPYFTAFGLIVLIFLFRNHIKSLLFKKKEKINIKTKFLTGLINITRMKNKKQKEEELLKLLRRFFKYLKIKPNFTRVNIIKALEKGNIRGDLKQQIIYLFTKLSDYKNEDKGEIINIFRRVLGRF